MPQQNARQIVRVRNRRLRILNWTLFYLAVLILVATLLYQQTTDLNTLELPKGDIKLSVSKTTYTVGDTVTYTIKNNLDTQMVLATSCPSEPLHVYSWKNSSWVQIHTTASKSICKQWPKRLLIKPGESLTRNYQPWAKLFNKPGIYRLVAFANNYSQLPYADFRVVDKPAKPQAPQVIYKPIYKPIYIPVYTNNGGGGEPGDD